MAAITQPSDDENIFLFLRPATTTDFDPTGWWWWCGGQDGTHNLQPLIINLKEESAVLLYHS
jgi:hypothetical protein